METTRTYWRNGIGKDFKKQLADYIGSFAVQSGDDNQTIKLDPIVLRTQDGSEIKITGVKSKFSVGRNGKTIIPENVEIVFSDLHSEPVEIISIDSMLLLLDAIDQTLFPKG